jgi:hypothetical protein
MNPREITEELGITPTKSWKDGDPVVTPVGRHVGGKYRWSSWGYAHEFHPVGGGRPLDGVVEVIQLLHRSRDFLARLSREGARLHFSVIVSGELSDELEAKSLAMLAEMGFNLGVVVTTS